MTELEPVMPKVIELRYIKLPAALARLACSPESAQEPLQKVREYLSSPTAQSWWTKYLTL